MIAPNILDRLPLLVTALAALSSARAEAYSSDIAPVPARVRSFLLQVQQSGSAAGNGPSSTLATDSGVSYEHSRVDGSRDFRPVRPGNGTPVLPLIVPDKPGRRGRQAGGGRTIGVGMGTFLITVGAILLFALTAESPSWLNLRVVGVILILAGVLGLVIAGVARARGTRFRRWVEPMLPESDGDSPADLEKDLIRRPGTNGYSPALADAILRREHDPPI
jgi:hypothetical protein